MQSFYFSTEVCLGYHCCGGAEYVDAEGFFELEDEDVNALVQLIRENDRETDIEELNLKNKLPRIYKTINDAYRDAVNTATTDYWILEGYHNYAFEESDGAMDTLEKEGLFKFEPDLAELREELGLKEDEEIPEEDLENAKSEAFEEWKDEYFDSLTEEEQISFIETYYDVDIENRADEYDYTLEIPQEIVDLSTKED